MLHLVLTCLLFVAPAQDDSLLVAVPAKAQALMMIHDVESLRERGAESAWFRIFKDPEILDLIGYFTDRMEILEDEEFQALTPEKLLKSVSGDILVFLQSESHDEFGMQMVITPGAERDGFDEYLDTFQSLLLDDDELVDSTESYGDFELSLFEPQEGSKEGGLILCDTGEAVVLGAHSTFDRGLEMVQETLDRLAGTEQAASILDDEAFLEARDRVEGQGMIELYCRVDELVKIGLETVGQDEEELTNRLDYLGVDDLGDAFLKIDVGEGESSSFSLSIDIEGEGAIRGFVDCFMGPLPLELLKMQPARAGRAQVTNIDINGIYSRSMELLKQFDENVYNQYRGIYENMFKKQYNIDFEKEILPLLSGQMGSFALPITAEEAQSMLGMVPEGVSPEGQAFFVGISDSQTFQTNFEKILRSVGLFVSVKSEEFQGHKIYTIRLPGGAGQLNWMYTEESVVFCPYSSPIRAVVRLLGQGDQESVLDKEEYAPFLKKYAGASGLAFADTAAVFKQALGGVKGAMAAMSAMQVPLQGGGAGGRAALPVPGDEVVDKYFKGILIVVTDVDEAGLRVHVIGR